MPEFKRSLAVVIGINQYDANNGIPALETAVHDAKELGFMLADKYQYQVLPLLDTNATQSRLDSLLAAFTQKMLPLPDGSKVQIEPDDRVLFYFAGHGIALDGLDNAEGPAGYLVPQDARLDDSSTLLPMQQLHDALVQLPCRHLLIILDCCFAGTFRWAGLHRDAVRSQRMYRERYERFTSGCAQQVITSAAYDEKALDSLYRFGQRGQREGHSPFANLLLKALDGAVDLTQDGVLTATELYVYLHSELGKLTAKQTPGFCQLKGHDKGEYIFVSPDFAEEKLQKAPRLDEQSNPYRGLESFDEAHKELFFGRQRVINELYAHLSKQEKQPLTVVLGASGTGKSSVVKAGLLPRLREKQWQIIGPLRPGKSPFTALAKAVLHATNAIAKDDLNCINGLSEKLQQAPQTFTEMVSLGNNSEQKLILVIDQFEELVTMCQPEEQQQFLSWLKALLATNLERLQVVITLRSDFEPQFSSVLLERSEWMAARFVVPPLTQDELREVIEKPAAEKVIYFEPPKLVEQLINDVVQMPGALPLLSFTLSELYLKYLQRRGNNRAMTQEDYEGLCGVMGSLTKRATEEYEKLVKLDSAYEQTVRRVMLRMVSVEGGESARRRVPKSELVYRDAEENQRVKQVIQAFSEARLIVEGTNSEGEPYVEPAHDALVRGWDKLQQWKKKEQENIVLQRRLTPAALEWKSQQKQKFLWNGNPYLDVLSRGLKSSDNWYNNVEAEFVKRSVRQKHKNIIVRWSLAGLAFLALSGFTTAIWLQLQQTELREKAAKVENLLSIEPVNGLVLAIQATGQNHSRLPWRMLTQVQSSLLNAIEVVREKNFFEVPTNVYRIAFSPDGKTIITGIRGTVTVRLWNIERNLIEQLFQVQIDSVESVAFSPDGKTIITGSRDGTVRLWDIKGNLIGQPFQGQHGSPITSIAFSPDAKRIVSGSDDGTVRLWDIKGNLISQSFQKRQHEDTVFSVAFSPDGKTIITGSRDGTARLWDIKGNLIGQPFQSVLSVAFSPDGKTIITGNGDGTLRLWDIKGNLIGKPFRAKGAVRLVNFSPDGKRIVSGSDDGTVHLWDIKGNLMGQPFQADKSLISISFSPDGKTIFTGNVNGRVGVWDIESNSIGQSFRGHDGSVFSVAFSPEGKRIVSGSDDGTVRLWDSEGKPIGQPFRGHDGSVFSVAFSPDGRTIISGGEDGTVRLWNIEGNPIGQPFRGHDGSVKSVAFDGKRIVTGGDDGTARLWDIEGNSIGQPFQAENELVFSVALSPDGERILIGSSRGGYLKDIKGNTIIVFTNDSVFSVAFSPDGKKFVSGTYDGIVHLWDIEGNRIWPPFRGHDDAVRSIAFDGKRIATGGDDGTVRLWDIEGKPIGQPFRGHDGSVRSIAFSPDGRTIISSGYDGTVRLWQANWEDWLEVACNRLQHHPLLKQPGTLEGQGAIDTCQKYVWNHR